MSLDWGDGPITRVHADAYAQTITGLTASERGVIARDLAAFSPEVRVRGVFFEGLSRVVAKGARGTTMKDLFATSGVPPRKVSFSLYPHRDFYRMFFLAARALYPRSPLGDSMSMVARTFYPIFRDSMVGKTMSAFIGSDPKTLLARLADAYNLSVPWNEHKASPSGEREVTWRCKVEPSSHYRSIFTGIVTGAADSHSATAVQVDEVSSRIDGDTGNHVFRVRW